MIASKFDHKALGGRLDELGIDTNVLAAILRNRYTPAEIEDWRTGDAEPDGEARIRLRIVTDPARTHAAHLAVEAVRHRRTLSLKGGSGQAASIEPPYGTGDAEKKTGEGWK